MQSDFSWVLQEHHQKILSCLEPARFVGGSVRNTLLGKIPEDFDIATPHTPSEVSQRLRSIGLPVIPTGLTHGTVTTIFHGYTYEITTLRQDIETDGRHATVRYTDSWLKDAQRRDFTMNALYLDHAGQIYDEIGGQQDIENGYIRFIGQPEQRIHEDYLRILRFFRFWAFYGRKADPHSLDASCALKENLVRLPKERITKEFLRLLEAPDPWRVLKVLDETQFWPWLLGVSANMNAAENLKCIEDHLGPQKIEVRLAALGLSSFQRLSLSRNQLNVLRALRQPWASFPSSAQLRQSVYESDLEVERALEVVQGRLILQVSSTQGALATALLSDLLAALRELRAQSWPLFPLSGRDVMMLGAGGALVGELLRDTRHWWAEHSMEPSYHECLGYARTLYKK